MKIADITPVVLTFNEQENIARTLAALKAFPEVVVLDSGSTDSTRSLAQAFVNVRWHERPFDCHANQWNHAIDLSTSDWILSLDADYQCPDALIDEVSALPVSPEIGYGAGFRFAVHGKPLRSALLPPRVVLFHRDHARYKQDGHTQSLDHAGTVVRLNGLITHDDRKPLSRWLWAQLRYVSLEADKLATSRSADLDLADRLRQWIVVMPLLTPLYLLVVKFGVLDGWRGLHYAMSRTFVEVLLALTIIDRRFVRDSKFESKAPP